MPDFSIGNCRCRFIFTRTEVKWINFWTTKEEALDLLANDELCIQRWIAIRGEDFADPADTRKAIAYAISVRRESIGQG